MFYAGQMSVATKWLASGSNRRTLLLLAWAGNAAVLAFDQFNYEYPDNVSPGQLSGELLAVSPVDVGRGFFTAPFFGLINVAMPASMALILAVERYRRIVLLVLLVLSAPLALLAFLSLTASLAAGLDGEWLGEGWPIFEAFFFWGIALAVYSVFQISGSPTGEAPI